MRLAWGARSQFNPLTGTAPTVRVLSNLYGSSPLGAASITSNRVTTQCFGTPTCDTLLTTRRIDYEYIASAQQLEPGEDWAGLPFDSIIHDRRGPQDVQERHHYYYDKLKWIDEDASGINRRTTFEYNSDDLIEKTTFPDGSCELGTYEGSDTYKLISTRTFKSREACNGEPGAAPGRTTKYTYEWLTGQVLTETGPGAFSTGFVPAPFDPTADAHKGFTTFYFYDVHQSVGAYPPLVSEACSTWSIPCPAKLGDLNNDGDPLTTEDADDNAYWSGALVKTQVIPRDPDPDGTPDGIFLPALETKRVVSQAGRPIRQTDPAGVSTAFAYYTSGTSWGLVNGTSSTGNGPLAKSSLKAIGATRPDLTTKFAYNTRAEVTVTESPTGERLENTLNGGGLITEQARTALVGGTWTSLNRMRSTYDLLGRPIQVLVVEATAPTAAPTKIFRSQAFGAV